MKLKNLKLCSPCVFSFLFFFFAYGHIHNVVSTLPNVVKTDVENDNFVLKLWNWERWFDVVKRCNFQRWRTQHCFNVDLTLCDVATSYQPKDNVETTLKCLLDCVVSTYILCPWINEINFIFKSKNIYTFKNILITNLIQS